MAGRDFFASKRAAAVFKHGILKRYPVVFASRTGRDVAGNRVVFLDGYAGRGEYGEGEPGSPLLLSRCAEYVSTYRNVLGFFVEQDEDNFDNLRRVLDAKGGNTRRVLRCGSVSDHLPELLTVADGAALFAFLDPFGLALDFESIRNNLLGRPSWPRTEVLLHFSVLAVARMGRAVHLARTRGDALTPADQKTAEQLDRFLGGAWWQDEFARVHDERDEETATQSALRVCKIYESKLTSGTRYQAISMPVRPRSELQPKYVLTLFTANNAGAWSFADTLGRAGLDWWVAWKTDMVRRGEAPGQGALFGEEVLVTPEKYVKQSAPAWTEIIAGNIDRLLDETGPFRLDAAVPEVYGTTLGQAWERHVRAAVKLLAGDRVANSGKGDFWAEMIRRP
ncbi:three-Cys-motif partner protein TcmP [Micromonospora sp. WMMD1102]|uniref:three-Cys-motif partner protein TcmP n=1 Tax=Micromonospora sp. WMMD1102 TaxID=3016105 RepID=UPI0024152AEF|nr:three-Cys-motif partner protein TcmP [Micromonospora sp. WMMD1102]MDG4784770.1 three-Cys-motif partner protein TcmP [Micromonospora sp. WMMD1102]